MYDTLTQKYNLTTKHKIRENNKKEGIEIYFTSIPSGIERDTLKENNWKWSAFNKCWYIKKIELGIETQKLEEKKAKIEKTKKVEKVANVEKTKTNDKQVIATINKILKYNEKARPVLSKYTQLENNKVAFTDSYRLCILNRDSLPFEKEEEGKYPNINKIVSDFLDNNSDETFTFNAEEVKNKTNENKGIKNKEKRCMEFTTNKGNKITLDSEYLNDMVKLLQIKDPVVKMNYYGDCKPTTYENENGFYLALPIKKY